MAKKELMRKVWRWTRRGLLGLLVLFVLSAIGFELWRQNEISNADERVEQAQARLNKHFEGTPSVDEWREALVDGTNGQDYFIEEFLRQLHNYQVDFPDNPVESIDWLGWNYPALLPSDQPSRGELEAWLAASDPIAKAVAGLADFQQIMIDPNHPAFDAILPKYATNLFLFSLMSLDVPAKRVVALTHLGRNDEALEEFRNLRSLTNKLKSPASWAQLLYLGSYHELVRELEWRLAADYALPVEDFAHSVGPLDWTSAVEICCEGTLRWVVEGGPTKLIEAPERGGNSPGVFAWLNPFNYEKWKPNKLGDEFVRLSIMYAYERRGFADWVDYSLGWLEASENGTEPPEPPEYIFFLPDLVQWQESLSDKKPSAASEEWRNAVLDIRRLHLEGTEPADIRAQLPTYTYIDVEWAEQQCTPRYRYDEKVWQELHKSDDAGLPSEREFYAEYPPATIRFD